MPSGPIDLLEAAIKSDLAYVALLEHGLVQLLSPRPSPAQLPPASSINPIICERIQLPVPSLSGSRYYVIFVYD